MRGLLLVAVLACKSEPDARPAVGSARPIDAQIDAERDATAMLSVMNLCTWITVDEVERVLGVKNVKATPMTEHFGGCTWELEQGVAFASAHPAVAFDAYVESIGETTPIAGVGEKAVASKHGLVVKVAGKPYFLKFQAVDDARVVALATAIIAVAR